MTDAHCEPPEELRGKDGWHWLSLRHADPVPAWWDPTGFWGFSGWVVKPDQVAMMGHCYVGPCLTPAELAALRAEREAAWNEVEREREKYKDDMHAALVEVARWSQRSGLQDAELTTLRAEVEKLKRLLEECANDLALEIEAKYAGADKYPSEAKRRDRDMEIVNLARAALNPEPANAVEVPE